MQMKASLKKGQKSSLHNEPVVSEVCNEPVSSFQRMQKCPLQKRHKSSPQEARGLAVPKAGKDPLSQNLASELTVDCIVSDPGNELHMASLKLAVSFAVSSLNPTPIPLRC